MSDARLTFPLPTPTTDDTRHQVRARPRKHAALTTLYPRSPYARQHDAMRCCSCCHAHVPRYCLPLLPHHRNHSAATALLRAATAAACTLMASHCCCLATATLLPSPPTLQQKQTTKAVSVPASSRHRLLRHSHLFSSPSPPRPHPSPLSPRLPSTSPPTPSPPPLQPANRHAAYP
jgi:hypothetical protein